MDKKASHEIEITRAEAVKGTPLWFARNVLDQDPYGWQERVLWDVAIGEKPVALRAANGSGKTQNVALTILLWHAAAFANSQAVTTAGVYRQVKEQLWGNLGRYQNKLGRGWTINATDFTAPNDSKAIGFSTDDPGKFEGWHNKNLLMIFDEAKSIPDSIFAAAERCQPNRVLLMSSAGTTEGEFASAFTTRRSFYSQHTVTAYDCPHLSDTWINTMIEKWGRNHPLIRSMIFSEFVDAGGSIYVVGRLAWTENLDMPPTPRRGMRTAFIDWAAGGDENAIAIVDGNILLPLITWRESDTMAAANRAAIELIKHQVPPNRIYADDGGLGKPINDAMCRGGFFINRVLNNARPTMPDHYANLGAELWYNAARLIESRSFVLPPDEILMEQATSRKMVFTAAGKLALERKEDMRARGLTSPDRADAALSAIAIADATSNEYFDPDGLTDSQSMDDTTSEQEAQYAGSFAGI